MEATTVADIVDECQLDCPMNLLELMLPPEAEFLLTTLIAWMEMTSAKMTQLANLNGKRQLKIILHPLLTIKKSMKEEKIDLNSTISFTNFKVLLKEKTYSRRGARRLCFPKSRLP